MEGGMSLLNLPSLSFQLFQLLIVFLPSFKMILMNLIDLLKDHLKFNILLFLLTENLRNFIVFYLVKLFVILAWWNNFDGKWSNWIGLRLLIVLWGVIPIDKLVMIWLWSIFYLFYLNNFSFIFHDWNWLLWNFLNPTNLIG